MSDFAHRMSRWAFPMTEEQQAVAAAARDFGARRQPPGAAGRVPAGGVPEGPVSRLPRQGLDAE